MNDFCNILHMAFGFIIVNVSATLGFILRLNLEDRKQANNRSGK